MNYRIPKDQIPCRFDHSYSEYIGEKWMGSCPMWECLWFELVEGDSAKADAIEEYINRTGARKCDDKCPGFSPVETRICKIHDEEFIEECSTCMKIAEAAEDEAREKWEKEHAT